MIEAYQKQINTVFRRHGGFAMAVIDHPLSGKRLAYAPPAYYCLPVLLANRVPRAKAVTLLDELTDAVHMIAREPVKVAFGASPFGLYIARRKAERVTLPLSVLKSEALRPLRMHIGRSYDYGMRLDHYIDLEDPETGHVLIAGQTGMGKSVALQDLLLSLLMSTSPYVCEVYLIDPKHSSLKPFDGAPHVRAFADEPHEIAYLVRHLFGEMRRRRKEDWERRIVLFVDELSELNYAPSAIHYLERLIKMGREYGIHIVAATQRPSAGELSTVIRSQFAVRIAGHVADTIEARLVTGQSGSGAEGLSGMGDMLFCAVGESPVRIQTYFPTALPAYLEKISRRYGDQRLEPFILPAAEEPEDGDAVMQERLAIARPVFFEYWDEKAKRLRYGGKSAILRAITGDDSSKLEGPTFDMVQTVIALIRAENRTQNEQPI